MDLLTVHSAFLQYQESMKNQAKKTLDSHRFVFRQFMQQFPHIEHVGQITYEEAQEFFFKGRMEKGWSDVTFRTYHKRLNVFYKWCIKQKLTDTVNPFEELEKPPLEKKIPKKLTKLEAFRILEIAASMPYQHKFLRYRNHAIIATFLYCGLRKNELLQLKCSDVDVEDMVITINQGKGHKDRMVPMPYPLKHILQRYYVERVSIGKTCPRYFASFPRDVAYTDAGLKRLIKRIVEISGIHFYPHMLRHTFATLMLEGGCDIYSLSKMMGHSDISTTTIYLSASVEHLRGEMKKHPLGGLM